jgi:aspartate aminotransferase
VIPDTFDEMLRPLERFEEIRRGVVRLGPRLCDLAYANPYSGVEDEVKGAIRRALAANRTLDLQYTPFGGQALPRRATADALRASHELDFDFADVVLTPGAMAALHLALRACARPGGEVIVPTPCWIDHPLFVEAAGLTPVLVPLAPGTFGLDVDAVARAISPRTCAVVLSHPANPTGRLYDSGAFSGLAAALARAERELGVEITLIADETHRDFVDTNGYESAAAHHDRTLIVYSFGKYHFLQGQRIGYVAASPRHPDRRTVATEMVRWTRVLGFVTPTALMQRALPELLRLRHDMTWLDRWRKRYVDELTDAGYEVVRPDATLFMYVGTPDGQDDFEFVAQLAKAGVLVLPAPVFHDEGAFRLSLTGSEDMLERALPILRAAAR